MPLGVFSRRRPPADIGPPAAHLHPVPRHFEAVAEALLGRRSPTSACAVAGAALAADGVSLGEALGSLAATYQALVAADPPFAVTEALSLAWSEETLKFLGDVSCEDPLTGLASSAHLRARLSEIYRAAAVGRWSVRTMHALVVLDVASQDPADDVSDPFDEALRIAGAAEIVRDVFSGGETLARIGRGKVVVLVRRGPQLGPMVAEVRESVESARIAARPRLWIEGLPDDVDVAVSVLAGLAHL